jgi:hypothetical protein
MQLFVSSFSVPDLKGIDPFSLVGAVFQTLLVLDFSPVSKRLCLLFSAIATAL